jgi:hypothetical protein
MEEINEMIDEDTSWHFYFYSVLYNLKNKIE